MKKVSIFKTLSIVASFLIFLFSVNSVMAGHNEIVRSKCRWWQNKYHAEAHLSVSYVPSCYHTSGSCGQADAQCTNTCKDGSGQVDAESHSGYSTWGTFWTFCSQNTGGIASPLVQKLNVTYDESSDGLAGNLFSIVSSFEAHQIVLKEVHGNLFASNDNSQYSSIEVYIWRPQDDEANFIEDVTVTPEKTLWKATAKIINGEIVFDGNFSSNDFTTTTANGVTKLTYSGSSTITVPFANDVNTDDLAVSIIGDGGLSETYALRKAETKTQQQLQAAEMKFEVMPNPTTDKAKIILNINEDATVNVEVYNNVGQLVKSQNNFKLSKGVENTVDVDFTGLGNGLYYILIDTGKNRLLKKISKQ
jgi:hypothetical protein